MLKHENKHTGRNGLWLLSVQYSHQSLHVTISKEHRSQPLCQWFGELARCVLTQALEVTGSRQQLRQYLMRVPMQKRVVIQELNKQQLQLLLMNATVLQQNLSCVFHIYQDLAVNNLSNDQFAKAVLLHIRMTNQHMRLGDIQMLLTETLLQNDEVPVSDVVMPCLGELQRLRLIQIIELDDGEVFIDSNPVPHSHIYYKDKRLLVDDLTASGQRKGVSSVAVRYC